MKPKQKVFQNQAEHYYRCQRLSNLRPEAFLIAFDQTEG